MTWVLSFGVGARGEKEIIAETKFGRVRGTRRHISVRIPGGERQLNCYKYLYACIKLVLVWLCSRLRDQLKTKSRWPSQFLFKIA